MNRVSTATAWLLATSLLGCSGGAKESRTPHGEASKMQADRYVKTAIHRSPEGIIMMPSRKAESSYERGQLNQIAQAMRVPAAVCFINRGIKTIKQEVVDGERTFTDIPEGQIKVRARIAPAGDVLRAEILESGFQDKDMEACLIRMVEEQRFPPSTSNLVQRIDVVYWVSLGFQDEDRKPEAQLELRRQAALAGNRASRCFKQGQVPVGTYPVDGLTLADRNGRTVANRIEPGTVPAEIQGCVTSAFAKMQMQRVKEGFIRPFVTRLVFEVGQDGTVTHNDSRWLELTTLEQRAAREAKRRELAEGGAAVDEQEPPAQNPTVLGAGLPNAPLTGTPTQQVTTPQTQPVAPATPGQPDSETSGTKVEPANTSKGKDPATGGIKLKLNGR